MNKSINNPFIAKFPQIDLHGETTYTFVAVIDDFIKDCLHLGKYDAIIIHGKGSGILKKAVHEYLKHNKNIDSFYLDGYNDGQTIIKLIH